MDISPRLAVFRCAQGYRRETPRRAARTQPPARSSSRTLSSWQGGKLAVITLFVCSGVILLALDIRTFLGKGAALDDGFARVELDGRRTDASINRRTTSP